MTKPMQMMTGAEIPLECLARESVECIFGYPGGSTLPLYDALNDHSIRHVLMRHEENACFAAEGYARASGKVGVCCATSGPGATNLITGLADAHLDSIPIVTITGQVSRRPTPSASPCPAPSTITRSGLSALQRTLTIVTAQCCVVKGLSAIPRLNLDNCVSTSPSKAMPRHCHEWRRESGSW